MRNHFLDHAQLEKIEVDLNKAIFRFFLQQQVKVYLNLDLIDKSKIFHSFHKYFQYLKSPFVQLFMEYCNKPLT